MQLGRASSRFCRPNDRYLFIHNTKRGFKVALQRKAQDVSTELSRTRNIGIIAHIDAVCHERDTAPGYNAYGSIRARRLPRSACSTIVGIQDE